MFSLSQRLLLENILEVDRAREPDRRGRGGAGRKRERVRVGRDGGKGEGVTESESG